MMFLLFLCFLDIYGLSIENIIYAGEEFLHHLLDLINNIIAQNSIPELVKVGLLSPIYKNKGEKNDSKNYRGFRNNFVID
jgi:hypothetical protein